MTHVDISQMKVRLLFRLPRGEKKNIFKNKTVAISQDPKERSNFSKYEEVQGRS